jgi:hypothetical protein
VTDLRAHRDEYAGQLRTSRVVWRTVPGRAARFIFKKLVEDNYRVATEGRQGLEIPVRHRILAFPIPPCRAGSVRRSRHRRPSHRRTEPRPPKLLGAGFGRAKLLLSRDGVCRLGRNLVLLTRCTRPHRFAAVNPSSPPRLRSRVVPACENRDRDELERSLDRLPVPAAVRRHVCRKRSRDFGRDFNTAST